MLQKFNESLSKKGFMQRPFAKTANPGVPMLLKSSFSFYSFTWSVFPTVFPKNSQPFLFVLSLKRNKNERKKVLLFKNTLPAKDISLCGKFNNLTHCPFSK